MNKPNKEQIYSALCTLVVHIIALLILLFVVIEKPMQQEEAGVSVVMGNVDAATGDNYAYTEVEVAPPAKIKADAPQPLPGRNEQLITQDDEPSVDIESGESNRKENEKPVKDPLQEQREREALEAERKRKEAEEIERRANALIAGAFGKGSKMKDSGSSDSGKGNEGSPQGNETTGVKTGVGGYGTFDLNGRSLGEQGLPRPAYNVQDEGRVVVNITVNSAGRVIDTSINSRTNTQNSSLRQAALKAAKRAVFNRIDAVNNQMGTITYYFKLK